MSGSHSAICRCLVLCSLLATAAAGLSMAEIFYGYESVNLLASNNWDFEEPFLQYNWSCMNALMTHDSTYHHTGLVSAKVTERQSLAAGARQRVLFSQLRPDTDYYFSVFFMLHQEPGPAFSKVLLIQKTKHTDGSLTFSNIGAVPVGVKDLDNWQQIGGDFRTPGEFNFMEFYLKLDSDVDYSIDTSSLIELKPEPGWRLAVDARIRALRTSQVTVRGAVPETMDPSLLKIHVDLTRHSFGFGGAIHPKIFNGNHYAFDEDFVARYRDYFYDNFEWAVFTYLFRWGTMEREEKEEEDEKFDEVDAALMQLDERGIPTRGHSIVYNNERNLPGWLMDVCGNDTFLEELHRRIDYVTTHYKNRFATYDVINDQTRNRYLESCTGKLDLLPDIFRRVEQGDPDTQLFINEYLILRSPGNYASAIGNMVRYLLDNGVKLNGVGLKVNLQGMPVPIHVLQKRLDVIRSLGLPIWISELSVHHDDVEERARILGDVMRLFFSQEEIQGVVYWGYSDLVMAKFCDDCALGEGQEISSNTAGDTWRQLVFDEWSTHEVLAPEMTSFSSAFAGFHGDYKMTVYYDNEEYSSQVFTLNKGENIEVDVQF